MQPRGVYPILPTPFMEGGAVDVDSVRSLIDFCKRMGVQGTAILGFLGEAHKLSSAERRQVIETVIDQSGSDLPTWVGVRAFGAAGAIEQAQEAQDLGAEAVFVAPIGVQDDGVLFDFYSEVAAAIGVPIVIHDYPASFGTVLSAALIARMAHDIPGVSRLKLEDPPVLQKLSRLRELAGDRLAIFGGLGGEYFLEELQRGADGIMTGFAFPEILVTIQERFDARDVSGAAEVFDRYMPLIRYEFQPKIGLALRKYIYQRRGAIATTVVRKPGGSLDATTKAELDAIVARVGLQWNGSRQVA